MMITCPIRLLTAALLVAMLATFDFPGVVAAPQKPNIIIILADDLGFGDPSCFNPQSKIQTPNLDRLAREGMRFTDAHAPASVCVPSRYGLLTGRYPFRVWSNKGKQIRDRNGKTTPHYQAPMLIHETDRLNLASLLKKIGYITACFGKWHQGMNLQADASGLLRTTPVDLGFDYYFGYDAPEQPPYGFIENKRFISPLRKTIPAQFGKDVTNPQTQGAHWTPGQASEDWDFKQCLPRIANKLDGWITKHKAMNPDKPFLIYHAIPGPHAPWIPGDAYKGKSGAGQYGDYVMTVDAMVGQLLDTLRKQGLVENTLVFFSSDNGPVWYEQDIARFLHRAAGLWRGMKGDLHEGGHRMPFLARWPGKIQPGSKCDQLICFTDFLATFASLVGEKLPERAGEDSFDISPLMYGEKPKQPIRTSLIHPNWGSYTLAIRDGDWALILPQWVYNVEDQKITPNHVVDVLGKRAGEIFELYNLRDDPSESHNLAQRHPAKVNELFSVLKTGVEKGRTRPIQ